MKALTLMAADAQRVATTDREATAHQVLAVAVHEARYLISEGLPGRAEFVMARAGMRAERILGSAS